LPKGIARIDGRTHRSGRPVPERASPNLATGVSPIAGTEAFAIVVDRRFEDTSWACPVRVGDIRSVPVS
jgi:hypothetical protein